MTLPLSIMQKEEGTVSMWIEHVFLGFLGLAAGGAVAAGTFAFIIVIGVVPRMIAKSNRAEAILLFENMIVLGGITGCAASVFTGMPIPVGRWILSVYGLCAGIFVGCIAVALAEILNTFPILFRRFKIKEGLEWVMLAMALGKLCGSMYYFYFQMASE